MKEVVIFPEAYCKIMMHAAKYPHCALNGILLAENNKNDDKPKSLNFVDAIPLFHICLHITPMAEIALSQVIIIDYFMDLNHYRLYFYT